MNTSSLSYLYHSARIFLPYKERAGNTKDSLGMAILSASERINRGKTPAPNFQPQLAFCLWLFSFCLLLSSCGGVPETYYYTLAFAPDSQKLNDGHAPLPFALGVQKFEAEVIYDDDRIIYRDSPYEIKYYFYRRWVAPPRQLVTEKVVSYLSDSGLFERVTAYPAPANVKYVLSGRLLAFEEWDEQNNWYGKVVFSVSLHEPATQRVVWKSKFEHLQPVTKKIPAAFVEALSLSMKKCLDDLAKSIASELSVRKDTN
jgi:ABC-type uncharacterized transport system auxiliary subunit